jgi:uncharacterized repeat protein (TIGR03803 family)
MRLGAIGVMLALSLGLTACGGGSSSSGGRSGVSASYTVGGTVSGLASGESLTLQNNGGDDLVVTANGSFTFMAAQPTGASYAVTVLTQPSGQTCTVANGSGTVADSDITNVAVTCPSVYTVGGSVSGLASGQSLILQDNGVDDLVVTANGSFTFSNPLPTGTPYAVTVRAQPSGQTCTVANGSGKVGNSDITNVAVTCASLYTVGGSVSGLASGEFLILGDNGGDSLVVASDGSFTFSTVLDTGASYAVTVLAQPNGQTCTVANGSGTVSDSDITNVAVNCSPPLYTIGVSVSGLASDQSLILQDNGGDDLFVASNGSFTFSTALPTGASYAVTVLAQPSGQTCTVANGSGTVADSNITNVAVTCWTESVLYSFTGQPNDGANPIAGLVDVDGNLYGTTESGGTDGYGTVFVINPTNGDETVLYSFTDTKGDGAYPEAGLVMDSSGTLYGTTLGGGTSGDGTVFEINPTNGDETVLYSFNGTDGAYPVAGLLDVGGNLYGTTGSGGTSRYGTVFEINPTTEVETVLYSFTGGNDGGNPIAGLVDVDGTLYGTTESGGTSGDGTVFEINPSTGEETVLHSFPATNGDGAHPEAGLVMGTNGNLYGTTVSGGAYGYGTVFEINLSSTTGVETVLYSFTGGADGADPVAGLVMGPHGTLYGTTEYGGTNNDGTVFEINPTTGQETVLYSFTGGNDGANPVAGLLDVNGILYGTTKYGGTDNDGTVFRIVP